MNIYFFIYTHPILATERKFLSSNPDSIRRRLLPSSASPHAELVASRSELARQQLTVRGPTVGASIVANVLVPYPNGDVVSYTSKMSENDRGSHSGLYIGDFGVLGPVGCIMVWDCRDILKVHLEPS